MSFFSFFPCALLFVCVLVKHVSVIVTPIKFLNLESIHVMSECAPSSLPRRDTSPIPVAITVSSTVPIWRGLYTPITTCVFRNYDLLTTITTFITWFTNKANLRDLIAATGLVILLKLDSNRRFFNPCDLDILWMTPKNNRAPLLHYTKLCASFEIHQWLQTEITVRKCPIWVKIEDFLAVWLCNLTYDLEKQ